MLNTISVSQLNTYVKSLIENDKRLVFINVSGEISNFKNHFSSGHWYFTLKDKNASIRCVMFKNSACRVRFDVQDGLSVILKGRVSLYEKDGQYQFYAEEMHPVGEGDLALAFKQVKEKLEKEGLFDCESKRRLNKFPKRIAVVTSDTGAAVKDILNITASRYPACEIIMCPVLVQGDLAPKSMILALERVYKLNDIDTIIIGRGGGSAEDLHCFNNEELARKIYESPFPVISAVGHETDFTICDFVADVRASTPSHAAELATPDINTLKNNLNINCNLIKNKILQIYNKHLLKLSALKNVVSIDAIARTLQDKQLELDSVTDCIKDNILKIYEQKMDSFVNLTTRLNDLSPLNIMARGFSVAYKDEKCVSSVAYIKKGDNLNIRLKDGIVNCEVIDKQNIQE